MPVGNGVLSPNTIGVRFRNFTAGQTARVSAKLATHSEPPLTVIAGGSAGSPLSSFSVSSVVVDVSASGSTTLVAGIDGQVIQVVSVALMAAGGVQVKFQSAVGPTDLTGPYTLVASTGFVLGPGAWFKTVAGEGLAINLSSAIQVGGVITYRLVNA